MLCVTGSAQFSSAMQSFVRRILLASFLVALLGSQLLAGTNGILEGAVKDQGTGEHLAGVNVTLADIQRHGSTDGDGHFEIQNIRAGTYIVRFTLVGYRTCILKNVVINPDLRTRVQVELESSELQLGEVTVVRERPLIQTDITGTTFIVSGEDFQVLPLDRVADVIRQKAGVTLEGNVRGGKTSEVLYLVDGLPVQDVMAGGASADLPNSSIVGISMYTGGFEPEYGNALSGVVNIVTKTGSDSYKFFLKADKDNLFGGTQTSRANQIEVSSSGPLAEHRLFYLGAVNVLLTDTRWWQDLQHFFGSPIEKYINAFGKIDYHWTPTRRLGAQVLYSLHEWHDYEFDWRFNLGGLPPERRTSYRAAVLLSDSPRENFFYTVSLSRFSLNSEIGTGARKDLPVGDPYQYDFFLRYVIDGQRAWWSRNTQTTSTLKADGTLKAGKQHLVKFGGEFNVFELNSDVVKYEPRRTYFGKTLINEPQWSFGSSYSYYPRSGSLYVQDKIDLLDEGLLLNAGLRYDFLDPTANRPAIEAVPVHDTAYAFNTKTTVRAGLKQQISPRFGAALQLAEQGYLFVNVGWYFQYPLFDYLYTGLDRVALAKGLSAFTGNPDLEPERTQSLEISLKYSFASSVVGSVTYFRKETTNQIDTKTFIPGDSKLAGSFGFAEYVNTPSATASGVEVTVSRERGEWLTGELSYTFMTAEGTSVSAQDGFYIAQYGLPPASRVFPLSWDQRHAVKIVSIVTTPWDIALSLLFQWHSGLPYTSYPTSTGFEPVTAGRFHQNNGRMPSYVNADVKLAKTFRPGWWGDARIAVYLDVRNLLNEKNVRWVDSNGRTGGELDDPSGYFIGRRMRMGVQIDL